MSLESLLHEFEGDCMKLTLNTSVTNRKLTGVCWKHRTWITWGTQCFFNLSITALNMHQLKMLIFCLVEINICTCTHTAKSQFFEPSIIWTSWSFLVFGSPWKQLREINPMPWCFERQSVQFVPTWCMLFCISLPKCKNQISHFPLSTSMI